MTTRKITPQFPRLAYAETTRCMAKPTRTNSGIWTACVKPAGHDGNHLQDVHPANLAPKPPTQAEREEAFHLANCEGSHDEDCAIGREARRVANDRAAAAQALWTARGREVEQAERAIAIEVAEDEYAARSWSEACRMRAYAFGFGNPTRGEVRAWVEQAEDRLVDLRGEA